MDSYSSITRRRFLLSLGALSAGYIIRPSLLLASPLARPQSKLDQYSFVDELGMGPELNPAKIEREYHPLHAEQTLIFANLDQQQMLWFKKRLKFEFSKAGMQWKKHYEVVMTSQHYGVNYTGTQADQLLAHCENVQDYLYSRLHGLYETNIQWDTLKSPANLTQEKNRGFQGIIGRYTYRLYRVLVSNIEYDDSPCLVSAEPGERAFNFINDLSGTLTGVIYIIPGKTSLLSPFSEILHLTLHEPAKAYEHHLRSRVSLDLARQRAILAAETVNEAAAIVLSSEFLKRFGHHNRLPVVNHMARNLSQRLPNLNSTIAYISQHGAQISIDHFRDDPVNFISRLT